MPSGMLKADNKKCKMGPLLKIVIKTNFTSIGQTYAWHKIKANILKRLKWILISHFQMLSVHIQEKTFLNPNNVFKYETNFT